MLGQTNSNFTHFDTSSNRERQRERRDSLRVSKREREMLRQNKLLNVKEDEESVKT